MRRDDIVKKASLFTFLLIMAGLSYLAYSFFKVNGKIQNIETPDVSILLEKSVKALMTNHPLSIERMRNVEYPGSEITIEEELTPGSNYTRYIASYYSDGYKIYSLLTIPTGEAPEKGFPVIVFNHGYIPPAEYRTTERYVAYTDIFSRNGYIVIKPDYRGHGNSEGNPEGAYFSPAYTVDVLNAVSSVKKFDKADPDRIGMWGHSMGGSITLRSMVVTGDIKAGSIWGGVVASYQDMAENWNRGTTWKPSEREQTFPRPSRQQLLEQYGSFLENPEFWRSISPIYYVSEVSGPIQIQHAKGDTVVPILFSIRLKEAMENAEQEVEYFDYEGDDHNISANLNTALNRSLLFFDKHLKNN
jgi:uncharacterized protein